VENFLPPRRILEKKVENKKGGKGLLRSYQKETSIEGQIIPHPANKTPSFLNIK
jgi:hypothetical protein